MLYNLVNTGDFCFTFIYIYKSLTEIVFLTFIYIYKSLIEAAICAKALIDRLFRIHKLTINTLLQCPHNCKSQVSNKAAVLFLN